MLRFQWDTGHGVTVGVGGRTRSVEGGGKGTQRQIVERDSDVETESPRITAAIVLDREAAHSGMGDGDLEEQAAPCPPASPNVPRVVRRQPSPKPPERAAREVLGSGRSQALLSPSLHSRLTWKL